MAWPELTQAIQSCTACELCHGRKQAVPGMILALGRLAAQTVLAVDPDAIVINSFSKYFGWSGPI